VREGLEAAAGLILDAGLVPRWTEGAIYPSELAFFLAVCHAEGVTAIIESGRQDGYSTEILGLWAARVKNVTVSSIDNEADQERANRCRQRLADLPVTLLKDDACAALGREARRTAPKPTALLIDGPKHFVAIALAAAAADEHLKIFSLHNLGAGAPDAVWLRPFDAMFHEQVSGPDTPIFNRLREAEISHCRTGNKRSTLGVIVLDAEKRQRLRGFDRKFGLLQPPIVRMLWKANAHALAPWLHRASFNLSRLMP
jgi:hypothetical protein